MLAEVTDLLIPIDAASPEPLHRQVYQGVREAILSGHLATGVRIPSSRRLASHLSVSRSTVLVAFEQHVAEGFIDGAVGSGSYVAREPARGAHAPGTAARALSPGLLDGSAARRRLPARALAPSRRAAATAASSRAAC